MNYKIGDTIIIEDEEATIIQIIHTPKEHGMISEEPTTADAAKGNPLQIVSTEYIVEVAGVQKRITLK